MPTVRVRGDSAQAIVRVKKQGVTIFHEARTFPASEEHLAWDWARRLEARVKKDGPPARRLETLTLGAYLLQYGDYLAEAKPLRRSRTGELAQLAAEFIGTKLADLNPTYFVTWARRRRASGAGPATVQHNLMTVGAALAAAKPVFNLDVDASTVREALAALRHAKLVAKPEKRTRRPTDAEIEALGHEYDRVSDHPSTLLPMRAIMHLAIELPRRIGELTTARWADYGPVDLVLHDTKNPTAPRTEQVPVPPKARAILDALPRADERILPYMPESVSAAHQRACARLGIEDLHFHDFRREGVSRLFARGLDIPQVAKISGHLNWDMLKIYTDIRSADVLERLG